MSTDVTRLDPARLTTCLGLSRARTADWPLMARACGFDAVSMDFEHTSTSLDTAGMLCIAAAGAGLLPMVRIPRLDSELVVRILDSGAHGIIVSHVANAAEAQAVVESARFEPRGRRPMVGPNPVNRFEPNPVDQVLRDCDQATVVGVMIETLEAVADVERIAAVPGLDLLLIGAWDLSAALGVPQDFSHPRFRDAVGAVGAACRRQGKTAGIAGLGDLALLADFVDLGIRFVNAGTESSFFMEAARARSAALRDIPIKSE